MTEIHSSIVLPARLSLDDIDFVNGYILLNPIYPEECTILTPDRFKHETVYCTILKLPQALPEEYWDLRLGQDVIIYPYSQRVVELNQVFMYLVHCSDVLCVIETPEERPND